METISAVSINTPLLCDDEAVVGLDISTVSTGVAVLSNQGIKVANIDVSHAADKGDVFETIKRRLSLEKQLAEMLRVSVLSGSSLRMFSWVPTPLLIGACES